MESREREGKEHRPSYKYRTFFYSLTANFYTINDVFWVWCGLYWAHILSVRGTLEFSAGSSSAFIKIKRNSLITMLNCLLSWHNLWEEWGFLLLSSSRASPETLLPRFPSSAEVHWKLRIRAFRVKLCYTEGESWRLMRLREKTLCLGP